MQVATYYINNIPVYIRNLPSGDIAVWHPYDIELGKVIYQICYGKGYWNTKYKNWLVFSGFAHSVIDAIKCRGSHYEK